MRCAVLLAPPQQEHSTTKMFHRAGDPLGEAHWLRRCSCSSATSHIQELLVRHSTWEPCAGIRSAALWWIMSDESSIEGGGVPEMLAKLRRGDESGSPRWERFAMRLVVGHLLAYNIPGLDKVH